MTDWNIQSRAHACTACGRSFADKEPFHTLLFYARAELQRVDVCEVCWQQQYSQGGRERKGFISYWQGEYHAPVPTSEPIQKDTAETLLRKLIELNQPQYMPAGFILAVMLERKRLLKVKEQFMRDGQRVFIYEHPKTGDVFTITDPDLRLDQLNDVQRDVAALLEHGLPETTQPAQTVSPVPEPSPTETEAALLTSKPTEETQTTSVAEPGTTVPEGAVDTSLPQGPSSN